MTVCVVSLLHCVALVLGAQGELEPVALSVANAEPWVGQRVPIFVELRASGSFVGSASFDLPQIQGALLLKIGSPVVGMREIDGQECFIQTHEFALFSQRSGELNVPPFQVRFARRDGFTGPATDVKADTSAMKIEVRRPPGSEQIGFLVTTESIELSDSWDPSPGSTQVGAVFKRAIVQRSPGLPGMALAPAPKSAPEGIRVYAGTPEINDELERGEFLGKRQETITYLMQEPGTHELPALKYVWWNPKTQTLQSKTLSAVTFEVAPPVVAAADPDASTGADGWRLVLVLVVPVGLLVLLRRRVLVLVRRAWKALNSPARAAKRNLLRACQKDDAGAAGSAWSKWRILQAAPYEPSPELRAAVTELQRHLFGLESSEAWRGAQLARAFDSQTSTSKLRVSLHSAPALPPLNPGA